MDGLTKLPLIGRGRRFSFSPLPKMLMMLMMFLTLSSDQQDVQSPSTVGRTGSWCDGVNSRPCRVVISSTPHVLQRRHMLSGTMPLRSCLRYCFVVFMVVLLVDILPVCHQSDGIASFINTFRTFFSGALEASQGIYRRFRGFEPCSSTNYFAPSRLKSSNPDTIVLRWWW